MQISGLAILNQSTVATEQGYCYSIGLVSYMRSSQTCLTKASLPSIYHHA